MYGVCQASARQLIDIYYSKYLYFIINNFRYFLLEKIMKTVIINLQAF